MKTKTITEQILARRKSPARLETMARVKPFCKEMFSYLLLEDILSPEVGILEQSLIFRIRRKEIGKKPVVIKGWNTCNKR